MHRHHARHHHETTTGAWPLQTQPQGGASEGFISSRGIHFEPRIHSPRSRSQNQDQEATKTRDKGQRTRNEKNGATKNKARRTEDEYLNVCMDEKNEYLKPTNCLMLCIEEHMGCPRRAASSNPPAPGMRPGLSKAVSDDESLTVPPPSRSSPSLIIGAL